MEMCYCSHNMKSRLFFLTTLLLLPFHLLTNVSKPWACGFGFKVCPFDFVAALSGFFTSWQRNRSAFQYFTYNIVSAFFRSRSSSSFTTSSESVSLFSTYKGYQRSWGATSHRRCLALLTPNYSNFAGVSSFTFQEPILKEQIWSLRRLNKS